MSTGTQITVNGIDQHYTPKATKRGYVIGVITETGIEDSVYFVTFPTEAACQAGIDRLAAGQPLRQVKARPSCHFCGLPLNRYGECEECI